jgi:hypothetical protein
MDTTTTDTATDVIQDLLWTATRTWGFDARLDADALAELLPWLPDVQHLAEQMLDDRLQELWATGWTPADLAHVVGRRLHRAHVAAVALRIVADGDRRLQSGQRLDPRWQEQVASLRDLDDRYLPADERLRQVLDIIGLTRWLPSLPFTIPRPGDPLAGVTASGRFDDRALRRVRALLAKAESTTFEEEAHAFTAKAQELMARHSLDEARLRTGDDVGEPSQRRILLDDPYLDAKASVVSAVASANRCRAVLQTGLGWVHVLGYEQDLDTVELLSTSLLAQATTAMVRKGPQRDHSGRSRTRSYRRGFLLGFASRVGQRLRHAAERQVSDVQESDGGLLPVLAGREDRIRAAEERAFPNLRTRRSSPVNPAGWLDGSQEGDRANLDAPAGRLPGTGRS